MYGKLFAQMYDGTLRADWRALVTFQQMIILCDADGVIDMTPDALAARTGIPLDVIQAGIASLEAPDPRSRTPDREGRRIERLDDHRDWGWRIVNHARYRKLVDAGTVREQNRIRQANKRERDRHAASRSVTPSHACHAESRHTDTDTDTKKRHTRAARATPVGFDRFWDAYPRKIDKADAEKAFRKVAPDDQLLERMLAALERFKASDQWRKDGGQFIPHAATWLNKRRWEAVEQPSPKPQTLQDLAEQWGLGPIV